MLSKLIVPLFPVVAWITLTLGTAYANDEITLYFVRSPFGTSWKNPRELFLTTVRNQIGITSLERKHRTGHALIRVACTLADGEPVSFMTGAADVDDRQEDDYILKDKAGLGVLFAAFAGRLQPQDEVLGDLTSFDGSKRLSWVTYTIGPKTCARLNDYWQQYQAGKYYENYGLSLDPLKREGAGCTSFATSFLKVAGLLSDDLNGAWSRSVRVPRKLVREDPSEPSVTLGSFIFSSAAERWANPNEAGRDLFFYDPDEMEAWARARFLDASSGKLEALPESNGDAVGIRFADAWDSPPDGPIFEN